MPFESRLLRNLDPNSEFSSFTQRSKTLSSLAEQRCKLWSAQFRRARKTNVALCILLTHTSQKHSGKFGFMSVYASICKASSQIWQASVGRAMTPHIDKSLPCRSWIDIWDVMSQECREEVILVDCDSLMGTLDSYLRKHRYVWHIRHAHQMWCWMRGTVVLDLVTRCVGGKKIGTLRFALKGRP